MYFGYAVKGCRIFTAYTLFKKTNVVQSSKELTPERQTKATQEETDLVDATRVRIFSILKHSLSSDRDD